jgi:hypothetical protein
MTTEEQLNRLTGIVESLAASVVHQDDQIGDLIAIAQKHQEEMDASRKQAYLRRLPPQ